MPEYQKVHAMFLLFILLFCMAGLYILINIAKDIKHLEEIETSQSKYLIYILEQETKDE